MARGVRRFPLLGVIAVTLLLSMNSGAFAAHNFQMVSILRMLFSQGTQEAVFVYAASPQDTTRWMAARTLAAESIVAIRRNDTMAANRLIGETLAASDLTERDWFAHIIAISLIRSGKTFEVEGDVNRAEALYRQAIAIAPKIVEPHNALANLLEYYRQDIPGAIIELEAVTQLNPTPANLLALAARYRNVGRLDEARELLDQVDKADPAYAEAVAVEKGWLALDQKDVQSAVAILEAARDRFPSSANVWYVLAIAYDAKGLTEQSLSANRMAIQLDPKLTWAYLQIASTLSKQNQLDQAEIYLKRLLAQDLQGDRTYMLGLLNLGDVYLRTGRADLARQAFCEAQSINRWGESSALIDQRIKELNGCE